MNKDYFAFWPTCLTCYATECQGQERPRQGSSEVRQGSPSIGAHVFEAEVRTKAGF